MADIPSEVTNYSGAFQYLAPSGIPVATPKFHSPLYKLAKLMIKPRPKLAIKKVGKHKTTKKKQKFY